MTDRLESLYQDELYYIRSLAVDFARDRPKIADRLNLDVEDGVSEDPHVERLIEAFAFLTARIRVKLEDEFPELTDALLGVLYPHYLAPIPSMSIVQFHLDPEQGQVTDGHLVPRGSQLYSREVGGVPCRFRTCYPTKLWPIGIASGQYQTAPFGAGLKLPPGLNNVEALVRLKLETIEGMTFSDLNLDRLRFFLSGDERTVHQLYELLLNGLSRVVIAAEGTDPTQTRPIVLPAESVLPVGFGHDEGLLPYPKQSFPGYRLLTEYFTFPSKFLFVDVTGFRELKRAHPGRRIDVYFLFDRADQELETRIDESTFRLGCTPIVNLFHQTAEPIRLTQTRTDYHVVPDVRHARSMEVYAIDEVSSTNLNTGETTEYQPFFAIRHGRDTQQAAAYWYARRRPSLGANDPGTEVDLALVDLSFNPTMPAAEVLTLNTTCTNRNLPAEIRTAEGESWGLQLEGQAMLRKIVPIVPPTTPSRLPFDEHRWRLISHLSLNHLSIVDDTSGADALKEMLKLYDYTKSRVAAQHIAGILSVSSRRKTARLTSGLASAICRGVEVTLEFDPDRYTGTGLYLFASVLDRFIGLYSSMNSFTRLVTRLKDEETPFKRWPLRAGEQTLI